MKFVILVALVGVLYCADALKCYRCGHMRVITGGQSSNPLINDILNWLKDYFKSQEKCFMSSPDHNVEVIECDTQCSYHEGHIDFEIGDEKVSYYAVTRGCASKENKERSLGCFDDSRYYMETGAKALTEAGANGDTLQASSALWCFCDRDFCNKTPQRPNSANTVPCSLALLTLAMAIYKMILN